MPKGSSSEKAVLATLKRPVGLYIIVGIRRGDRVSNSELHGVGLFYWRANGGWVSQRERATVYTYKQRNMQDSRGRRGGLTFGYVDNWNFFWTGE